MIEKSESITALAKALMGFQADVSAIAKTANNPFFKSKYAPLETIIDTIKEPLKKHGLSFCQLPSGEGLATIIMHTSGEWLSATARLELSKSDPQGQGSAITYMRRYALSAALGLATEEDDDGNGASTAPAKTTAKTDSDSTKAACPECGGDMWDNRPKKKSGVFSAKAPDFKCKDKGCEGTIWPKKTKEDLDDMGLEQVATQFENEQGGGLNGRERQ